MEHIFTDFDYQYKNQDHKVWNKLLSQQRPLAQKYACTEYIEGLEVMNFPLDQIPSFSNISKQLMNLTGWSLLPADKIIPSYVFFDMLSQKRFPIIRKIRPEKEIDFYVDESPDVFHEYFGHLPLLTYQPYAESMQLFGAYAKECDEEFIPILSKIYWATYEFGLIKDVKTLKIYGAGIIASQLETLRIAKGNDFKMEELDIFCELGASLQGNIHQETFYYINSLDELYFIVKYDLDTLINKASNRACA